MKTFDELTSEQKLELKQALLCEKLEGVSYEELADADALVSDSELEERYGATTFSDDDFQSNDKENDMEQCSEFASLDVYMGSIEWETPSDSLPKKERYSIGFQTLLENEVVQSDGGMDYTIDKNLLQDLVLTMLEADYGVRAKKWLGCWSMIPNS